MSEEYTTTCPACGALIETSVISVIHPGSDALHDLFKGQLNVTNCHSCDQTFTAETPLIYRDNTRRALVYYLPTSLYGGEGEAVALMDKMRTDLQKELNATALPACRLAMSYPEFIEKIALLQEGYDDRVIEYAKYILLQNAPEVDHGSHFLLYDFSAENADALTFIAYKREDNQADYGLEFDKSDFDELLQFFAEAPQASGKLDELFPGYAVNVGMLFDYAADNEE